MRKTLIVLAATAAVIAVAVWIGYQGSGRPRDAFDWQLFAVVLTGFGTTGLAAVTGLLSWATWQDVRASQRAAGAAEQQLDLARAEQGRRPALTLRADDGFQSRAETERAAYVRLLVSNEAGRRAARGTRVLIDGYWPSGSPSEVTTIGSPSLGWPSATEAVDASVVIFAGTSRPVDFGVLARHEPGTAFEPEDPFDPPQPSGPWHLKLALAANLALRDEREYLPPGSWTVRVIVGADEADGDVYLIALVLGDGYESPSAALAAFEIELVRA